MLIYSLITNLYLRGSVILNKNFEKIIAFILTIMCTLSSICIVSYADNMLTINMPENYELITKNPGKGWIRYGLDNPVYEPELAEKALYYSKLGYFRYNWAQLEPEEGKYEWHIIDDALEYWDSKGMTFAFGIMSIYTGNADPYVTPKWVFDAGAKYMYGTGTQAEYIYASDIKGATYLPIQNDPIYMEKYRNFLVALAERYDGDPRIEYIDIRSYGNYGEFHNIGLPTNWPALNEEEMKAHIDMHADLFKKTQLILCTGAFMYPYWNKGDVSSEYIINKGVGIRNDGGYDITEEVADFHGHEPAVNEQGAPYETFKAQRGFYVDRYLEYIKHQKFSYMDLGEWSRNTETFIKEQEEVIKYLTNKMGYHFVLNSVNMPKSAASGDKIGISFDWINKGITYLYRDAVIDVALLDNNNRVVKTWRSNTVPTINWAPDTPVNDTISLDFADVTSGEYKLAVGISLDDAREPDDGKPDFKIGNYGRTDENWYIFANAHKNGDSIMFSEYAKEYVINGTIVCEETLAQDGREYVSLDSALKALSSTYEDVEGVIKASVDTTMVVADKNELKLMVDGNISSVYMPIITKNKKHFIAIDAIKKLSGVEIDNSTSTNICTTAMYRDSLIEKLYNVENPGFEINNNSWSYDSTLGQITSEDKFEGEKSFKFFGEKPSEIYQTFKIDGATVYNCSLMVKSDSSLKIRLVDGTGNNATVINTKPTGGEWKEVSFNFDFFDPGIAVMNIPVTNSKIKLVISCEEESGISYIDDIRIAYRGEYKDFVRAGYLFDHGAEISQYTWQGRGGSIFARDNTYAYEGEYSFAYQPSRGWDGAEYVLDTTLLSDAQPGKYHFEIYLRTDDGQEAEYVSVYPIYFQDSNGKGQFLDTKVFLQDETRLTDEWRKVEIDFELTEEDFKVLNSFENRQVPRTIIGLNDNIKDQNGNRLKIYIDNAKLIKVE